MKSLTTTILSIVLALAFIAGVSPLRAQSDAKVTGQVKDESGKLLGGVLIDAVGQKTGEKRKAVTNKDGGFTLSQLPPDTYEISASLESGNDVSAIADIGAGQTRNVQLVVNTKSSASVVAVDTTATTMDTSSARLGTNVTSGETAALPVNGRTFGPLALSAPFVSNAGGANLSEVRFTGQSSEQNGYQLDGVDFSSVVTAFPGFVPAKNVQFRLRMSVESVQEFRVDSAMYPAEQGGVGAAQIGLVSKSGANEWHGALFEYLRNDKLQARNFFDNATKTELRMNQYGGNAGGVLKKDKLFVFGGFEKLNQRVGSNIFELVPSAAARAEAAPEIAAWVQSLPPGAAATADPNVSTALRRSVARQDETTYNARLDYLASEKNRLFLRYQRAAGDLLAPDSTTVARNVAGKTGTDNAAVSWNTGFGADVLNQLTLGLNRSPSRISSDAGIAALANARVTMGPDIEGGFASPGGLTRLATGGYGRSAEYDGRSYNLKDNVEWLKGAHAVKAGVEFRANRVPFYNFGGIQYAFENPDAFLTNTDADTRFTGDLPSRLAKQELLGLFVQDEWRARPNLSFNLGLRYDYTGAPREEQNRATLLNPFTLTSKPAQGGFYDAGKLGFQPRLGVTWAPKRWNGKTLLRAGVGIYQGQYALLDSLAPIEDAAAHVFLRGVSIPQTAASILNDPATQQTPFALDLASFTRLQRNYTYSVSIQQALPDKFVGQIAYLGIQSRHLTQQSVANVSTGIDPETGNALRPNQGFGAVHYLTNGGNSGYNALQLSLNRRFVDNLTLSGSYNSGHSIGDTLGAGDAQGPQNPNCLVCERASNDFDARQSINLNMVYDLPFGANRRHLAHGMASKLLGGWSLAASMNARTGLPLNVTANRFDEIDYSPSTHQYYSPFGDSPSDTVAMVNTPGGGEDRDSLRPNYVKGANPYAQGKDKTLWLNASAFSIPLPGTFGNLGRNAFRGPGFSQVDAQITRSFHVTEKVSLRLRAEAFNLLNHSNFSNPGSLLADPLTDQPVGSVYLPANVPGFGILNSTVGRTVGLGTSRQFQLGMRLEF